MQPEMIADRYRVLRGIGRGGMGTVWLCHDEVLGRDVAVKRMGALPGEDSASTTRAMREARVSAAMNHENAVAVFDVVDHDGGTWLVMEYFPSQTLADLVSTEGALPPQRVARIGMQVAAALASAHGLGIVHRDVKPGNILVGERDVAKISDFGIARGHTDLSLTQTGMMTGTPGYLSPELARGDDPSFASDAWALGATLYTAAEGTPPYPTQANPLAVLSAITREPPPPPRNAGALTPVIGALMQHDPSARWPMDQVRRELDQIVTSEDPGRTRALPAGVATTGAPPSPADDGFTSRWSTSSEGEGGAPSAYEPDRRRRVWWVAALVALIVVGIGAVAWGVFGPDDSPGGKDRTATQQQDTARSPAGSSATDGTSTQSQPTASEPTTASTSSTSDSASLAAAEDFVRNYYTLVPGDTDAGWAELSPRYQAETSRTTYDEFWSSFDSVSVSDVQGVSPTVVNYTISYDGSTPENKQITLIPNGSSYLIDNDGQQG